MNNRANMPQPLCGIRFVRSSEHVTPTTAVSDDTVLGDTRPFSEHISIAFDGVIWHFIICAESRIATVPEPVRGPAGTILVHQIGLSAQFVGSAA